MLTFLFLAGRRVTDGAISLAEWGVDILLHQGLPQRSMGLMTFGASQPVSALPQVRLHEGSVLAIVARQALIRYLGLCESCGLGIVRSMTFQALPFRGRGMGVLRLQLGRQSGMTIEADIGGLVLEQSSICRPVRIVAFRTLPFFDRLVHGRGFGDLAPYIRVARHTEHLRVHFEQLLRHAGMRVVALLAQLLFERRMQRRRFRCLHDIGVTCQAEFAGWLFQEFRRSGKMWIVALCTLPIEYRLMYKRLLEVGFGFRMTLQTNVLSSSNQQRFVIPAVGSMTIGTDAVRKWRVTHLTCGDVLQVSVAAEAHVVDRYRQQFLLHQTVGAVAAFA